MASRRMEAALAFAVVLLLERAACEQPGAPIGAVAAHTGLMRRESQESPPRASRAVRMALWQGLFAGLKPRSEASAAMYKVGSAAHPGAESRAVPVVDRMAGPEEQMINLAPSVTSAEQVARTLSTTDPRGRQHDSLEFVPELPDEASMFVELGDDTTMPHDDDGKPGDLVALGKIAAGGPEPPLGNCLQFLMNALIFAEAAGKKGVKVSGKIRSTLALILDLHGGVIEVKQDSRNSSRLFHDCTDDTGLNWGGCKVPLRLRRQVALRYLTPRLRAPGCIRKHRSVTPRLAIHLRSNEWCCDNPVYVQPPCALYDEILAHGNDGGAYDEATVYSDVFAQLKNRSHPSAPPWGNPCLRNLLSLSESSTVGGAHINASTGKLVDDVCDMISSDDIALADSTFSTNLVLMNPGNPRIHIAMPCPTCHVHSFRFFGLIPEQVGPDAQKMHTERFMKEFQEVFPRAVGYELPKGYLDAAKKHAGGEMQDRYGFEATWGRWKRLLAPGSSQI
eukprot:TRINITY_DN123515_c0_g1_i1.p1 TRINITY_DN123515_c0_g1~~TRINITY_DN123515_c0_g1_i1.p1  ORF type:complete len:506 (+),score=73.94 TRINITY_DN123515_c0_g1_i1:120-1637(+)